MIIKLIDHGSKDYEEMIRLRLNVLLDPIGIPEHYINKEKEKEDFLIAGFKEDEMIGCCVLTPLENKIIQLRQMAVQINDQSKGVGAAIVKFAESIAVENGFSTIMMHARNQVIGFYTKCGYSIVGNEFFEVGIEHRKMEKALI